MLLKRKTEIFTFSFYFHSGCYRNDILFTVSVILFQNNFNTCWKEHEKEKLFYLKLVLFLLKEECLKNFYCFFGCISVKLHNRQLLQIFLLLKILYINLKSRGFWPLMLEELLLLFFFLTWILILLHKACIFTLIFVT